jgi:hypothetical protein
MAIIRSTTQLPQERCLQVVLLDEIDTIIVIGFDLVMVFNATFNNISVISWRSVILVEETGVPGENHGPVASH